MPTSGVVRLHVVGKHWTMLFKTIITLLWALGSAQEVAEIRLVGGPEGSKCEGRVEIKQDEPDSQFGQACDLNARDREAEVVCRQLGCNPVGARRVEPVQYGFSSKVDDYVAFGFDCTGLEPDLNACWEPGATIRFDDPLYAVAVRCGPGEYDPASEPHPSPHREPEDKSPIKLKLDGGKDSCEGRLLVKDRQDYIPACCCDVRHNEVKVICRQLGCSSKGARTVNAKLFNSPTSTQNKKFFLDNVCNGTENNFDECREPKRTCSRNNQDPVQKGFEEIAIRCGIADSLPEATSQYTAFRNTYSLGIIVAICLVAATVVILVVCNVSKEGEKPRYSTREQNELKYRLSPDPQPDRNTLEYRELVRFSEQVEIILQVVNENEYQAAITMLEPPIASDRFPKAVVFPSPGKVVGMFDKHKTALIHTDVGSKATEYIQDGLDKFPAARFVIGVGVAYAIDRLKCKLGDVLVSKTISDLENSKFDGHLIDRGETIDVVQSITSIFCKDLMFKEPYEVSSSGRTAKVHCGKIISYNILLNDKQMRDKIHAALHEPIGGEMEGGQLLKFQKKNKVEGIVVVKGVSDYADGVKSKEWQFTASLAALNYVKDKLSYLAPS